MNTRPHNGDYIAFVHGNHEQSPSLFQWDLRPYSFIFIYTHLTCHSHVISCQTGPKSYLVLLNYDSHDMFPTVHWNCRKQLSSDCDWDTVPQELKTASSHPEAGPAQIHQVLVQIHFRFNWLFGLLSLPSHSAIPVIWTEKLHWYMQDNTISQLPQVIWQSGIFSY